MEGNMEGQTWKKGPRLSQQYELIGTVGQGAFGVVKLAYHRLTRTPVAIKVVKNTEKNLRLSISELAILSQLDHPHIVRLYQVLKSKEEFFFVMEYAPGGNLFQLVKAEGPLPEKEAQEIFGQIVAAIKYCHHLDIVHRDLKPQNILLDAEGQVKIIDFGLATRCPTGTTLLGQCGTKPFIAPELVLREAYDGKKADVWSLGVLLYFVTTGRLPFRGGTMKETEENVIQGTYPIPANISGQLENLIHQMLTVAPEKRPTLEEIEGHPWVTKCESNIQHESRPDSTVLAALSDLGFDATNTLDSLRKRQYNQTMATYLFIKEQARKGLELGRAASTQPVDPGRTPPPTPVHPSSSALPLQRRASEPSFGHLGSQHSRQQLPVVQTGSGLKMARSTSMPAMALCSQRTSPACSPAPSSEPVTASNEHNCTLEEEMLPPPRQDSDREAASPPQTIGCLKRLQRRIRACLSRLPCFRRAPKTQRRPIFSKKVAPLKETGG